MRQRGSVGPDRRGAVPAALEAAHDLFFCGAVFLIFAFMLWRVFRGMSRYFSEINQGIESLLTDDGTQIRLSPEMLPFERKLNAVKRTLAERKEQTALAERRKESES